MADGGRVFVSPFFCGGLKVSTLRRLWDGLGWRRCMALSGYIHHHHHHLFFFATVSLFFPFTTTTKLGRSWDWDWVGLWNGMEWVRVRVMAYS
jgi:hypothetical protein